MARKRGKGYQDSLDRVDRNHHYEPAEAVALLKKTSRANFDETVEVHIRLGVNVRHADEQLRGTLALPNGAGRDVTVAVFAEGDKAREATEAGAEFVGSDDAVASHYCPGSSHSRRSARTWYPAIRVAYSALKWLV